MLLSKTLFGLLLTTSITMAGCACGSGADGVRKMVARLEKELPLGSSEAQAAKFLDDLKVPHGEPILDSYDDLPRRRRLRKTGGTIENFWGSEPAMYLDFYFDDGKLVESRVRNACGRGCYSIRDNQGAVLSDDCE